MKPVKVTAEECRATPPRSPNTTKNRAGGGMFPPSRAALCVYQ